LGNRLRGRLNFWAWGSHFLPGTFKKFYPAEEPWGYQLFPSFLPFLNFPLTSLFFINLIFWTFFSGKGDFSHPIKGWLYFSFRFWTYFSGYFFSQILFTLTEGIFLLWVGKPFFFFNFYWGPPFLPFFGKGGTNCGVSLSPAILVLGRWSSKNAQGGSPPVCPGVRWGTKGDGGALEWAHFSAQGSRSPRDSHGGGWPSHKATPFWGGHRACVDILFSCVGPLLEELSVLANIFREEGETGPLFP